MNTNKMLFQWVIKIKWPIRIIWIWNTNSSITILIHFRWCPTIAVIILFHFLPFYPGDLPRCFTPDQTLTEKPLPNKKLILSSGVGSSLLWIFRNIFKWIRRASSSSWKTQKDKRPNGSKWTGQKRAEQKTVRKNNGPEVVHNPFNNLFDFNFSMS